MRILRLSADQASSAADIQRAIDSLATTGGRVELPELDLTLDRALRLRSGVELCGEGSKTVLRHEPGRVYRLAGYHNYGMHDVPLEHTEGLEPGMTVAVRDNVHGGFFETFAHIEWIDGEWVGLDRGLHSDYSANQDPVLVTAFPLVYGEGVSEVAVRDLTLDGNRAEQPAGIGACRGAAVYFYQSHHFEATGVSERGYAGEGLGFQMCRNVRIARCSFADNAGNGYHPGAGSTAVLFEGCRSEGNDRSGFFFCVRANHITVRDCSFVSNRVSGMSVGTRDCYNLIEACTFERNDGPGILFRPTPRPVEVHSCTVRNCVVRDNARTDGRGQIDIRADARDLALVGNEIAGSPTTPGIYVAPPVENVWLQDNRYDGCWPQVVASGAQLAKASPDMACGLEAVRPDDYRHLGF